MSMAVDWSSSLVEIDADRHRDEPMGTKDKFWVDLPGDDRPWLFKFARSVEGVVRGEDWAEWTVHHLANLIGVPSAVVKPAAWRGQRGVISRSVLKDDVQELIHGNSVLSGHDFRYDLQTRRENPGYTVDAVRAALSDVLPPGDMTLPPSLTGFDVWAGYLMLDAWVAGRDRHHENWAIVRGGRELRLAPTFDHGNALGFAESDAERSRLLDDETRFTRWLNKGRSHHFSGRPLLVTIAVQALTAASAAAADHWIERLSSIDTTDVVNVVESVPEEIMSAVSRRFVLRLLEENRRRVLDDYRASQRD